MSISSKPRDFDFLEFYWAQKDDNITPALKHLFSVEHLYRPSPTFLSDKQTTVNVQNRKQIIEWLHQSGEYLSLSPITTSKAINYMDRFLSKKLVARRDLITVGLTCMLLAVKQEQQGVPLHSIAFCGEMHTNTAPIRDLEMCILKTLDWRLCAATPRAFVDQFLMALPCDMLSGTRQQMLLENLSFFVALSDTVYQFLQYPASVVAAAALRCAVMYSGLNSADWTEFFLSLGKMGLDILHVDECGEKLMGEFRHYVTVSDSQADTPPESRTALRASEDLSHTRGELDL